MHRQEHRIKCETQSFQSIERKEKRFDIRKNDRDYREGDIIYLEETVREIKTGRIVGPLTLDYIVYGPQNGLLEGFCVFCWVE